MPLIDEMIRNFNSNGWHGQTGLSVFYFLFFKEGNSHERQEKTKINMAQQTCESREDGLQGEKGRAV
ncbi:hypothetical protein BPIT_25360 [Candidatus Brocadia pituitae]|nr:hypothetical protein BPIT_25360 [Candidatus Brocadia pituitae]